MPDEETPTLGGNIEVPTLAGKMARINIQAGAQGGNQFRLRGKGMPIVRASQRGDMYIEINVETPTGRVQQTPQVSDAVDPRALPPADPPRLPSKLASNTAACVCAWDLFRKEPTCCCAAR